MGAAISMFVVLSFSVLVIRIATVALRLTGIDENQARFQSLSAFTGTGFTTAEAEMIVNYPVRRRIVSLLMVIGNLGLVTVLATLVTSLVNTEGEPDAVVQQIFWLIGGLVLLWIMMLNSIADRFLCAGIGRLLNATTVLGQRRFHRLLQIGDGLSVCEHSLPTGFSGESLRNLLPQLQNKGLELLSIMSTENVRLEIKQGSDLNLSDADRLILFGADESHEKFGGRL